ncbi:MAG TPA: ComF family protein [Geminicoccaceae bacterium]
MSFAERLNAATPGLTRLGVGALDLLLPPRCLGCGARVEVQGRLCPTCWRSLTFIEPPWCRACGLPLPQALPEAPLCGACAKSPPRYDRARAALRYDDGSRGLILAFKHADRLDTTATFGTWLAHAGQELLAEPALVAPVPLHRLRLLRRGYNQAALLARAAARARPGLQLVPDLLLRARRTASQQGLGGQARLENVTAAAFTVHPRHRRRLAGRRVVLVDDVLTTGATVSACASVLRRGGAVAVDVLTLARVVRDEARAHIAGEDREARPEDVSPPWPSSRSTPRPSAPSAGGPSAS